MISPFPSGRRLKERSATTTTASVPSDVGDDRQQPRRKEGEVVLRVRDAVRGEGAVHRHRERDADREAGVDERHGRGAAAAGEEERARAEQRRREQGSGGVVDAEGAVVPARGLAPRDRGRRDRVGGEPRRPREQLRPSLLRYRAASRPASRNVSRPQRRQRARPCPAA